MLASCLRFTIVPAFSVLYSSAKCRGKLNKNILLQGVLKALLGRNKIQVLQVYLRS